MNNRYVNGIVSVELHPWIDNIHDDSSLFHRCRQSSMDQAPHPRRLVPISSAQLIHGLEHLILENLLHQQSLGHPWTSIVYDSILL